jgi:hypothetical protein
MNKYSLFWKIIGLSLLLGLQAGAILGLAVSLFFALVGGFWVILIGIGYGCALGSALGLVNGILLACLICLFFFPSTRVRGLRWVTQAGSIIISVLITVLLMRVAVNTYLSFLNQFSVIVLPIVGASSWWASCRVDDWYEEHDVAKVGPAAA